MQPYFLERKLIATFVSTIMLAITMVGLSINENEFSGYGEPDYGIGFALMTLIYGGYGGLIILVYGNAVSALIEFVMNKWFKTYTWLYILLHGIFGLIMILAPILAAFAVGSALLFACVDRWVLKRKIEEKKVFMIPLTPVVVYALLWGYFTAITPEPPPFTAEDAIEFAGAAQEGYPMKPGVITQNNVTRETSVKEIGHEVYIVTFKEDRPNVENGPYWVSYKIERGSLSLHDSSH